MGTHWETWLGVVLHEALQKKLDRVNRLNYLDKLKKFGGFLKAARKQVS